MSRRRVKNMPRRQQKAVMAKIKYRLNIYDYSSGRKINSITRRNKQEIKKLAKESEDAGFNTSVTTLENNKRKYWHDENWQELDEENQEYTKEESEADIINSPFSEGLGWVKNGELTQAGKDVANQYPKEKQKIAGELVEQSDGADTFWVSLHWKKDVAESKSKEINELLKGTGARSHVELARNYNPQGIPYGIAVTGFDEKTQDKMEKIAVGEL